MTNSQQTCLLTMKDFTILEVMRDRCLGRDDPLAPILKLKLETAQVMFWDDIPANVATLSSRVAFSSNGREADTRVISHDEMAAPVGLFLPISTVRGLALIGLTEGQEFVFINADGYEERIRLHTVHYQPEAAKREREALPPSPSRSKKPKLRVISGARDSGPRQVPPTGDGFDDPGPSAA